MKTLIYLQFTVYCLLFTIGYGQDTVYVPQDYPTIQQGIEAAVSGNVVLVDTGTYLENIRFIGKTITLASKYIYNQDEFYRDNTIIDGSSPANPDSASVVYIQSCMDTNAVLYGFTITGGSGTHSGNGIIYGGGVAVVNSSAKIVHNLIKENHLYNDDPLIICISGAGIFAEPVNAYQIMLIDNNMIIDNDMEGVSCRALGAGIGSWPYVKAWLHIHNNTIKDNDIITHLNDADGYAIGGGVFLEYVNAKLENNTIKANSCMSHGISRSHGGGISFGSVEAPVYKLTLNNNTIDSNTVDGYYAYGAGVRIRRGAIEIENNLFSNNVIVDNHNYNYGAGLSVYTIGVSGIIRNNDFINNSNSIGNGGALYLGSTNDFGEMLVDGNLFTGNSARYGGAVWAQHCVVGFTNNVFTENNAFHGAAVYLLGSADNPVEHPYQIVNSSFYHNDAEGIGGALLSNYGNPIILNDIFFSDTASTAPEIMVQSGMVEIAYSNIDTNLIYGNFIYGEGNINEDPMYCVMGCPCMIETGSPCLDAGILEYTCFHGDSFVSPDVDRLGVPRPQSGSVEMGAYELMFEGVLESAVSSQQSAVRLYPNPTPGIFNLQFTVYNLQRIAIKIYDLHGREVATVLDREFPAGEHVVSFDAGSLPPGVYIYQKLAVGQLGSWTTGKLIKF
jgi:hypothetical protein